MRTRLTSRMLSVAKTTHLALSSLPSSAWASNLARKAAYCAATASSLVPIGPMAASSGASWAVMASSGGKASAESGQLLRLKSTILAVGNGSSPVFSRSLSA